MNQADDLTLGRGKLYFERFADGTFTGTGEKFFGNCPTLQLTQNNTKLDHYKSTQGLKVKDRTVTLQNDQSGTFSTDNMNMDNLALWFLGTLVSTIIAAAGPQTEAHAAVLGSFVQLGVTPTNLTGARNITGVTVTKGVTPVVALNNFEVDLKKGRVYIEPDAADILKDDILTYSFSTTAGTQNTVVGAGTMIFGALRFISDNPVGSNKDYFWPYVQLTSSGNLDLIADVWQAATFAVEILQKDDATNRVYITQ